MLDTTRANTGCSGQGCALVCDEILPASPLPLSHTIRRRKRSHAPTNSIYLGHRTSYVLY